MIEILNDWFIKNKPLSINFINLNKVQRMIKLHTRKNRNYGHALWRVVFLEAWLKIFQYKFSNIN